MSPVERSAGALVPMKRLFRVTTSLTVSPPGSMCHGMPASTDVLWKISTPEASLCSLKGE
jgi:hypothetical protein